MHPVGSRPAGSAGGGAHRPHGPDDPDPWAFWLKFTASGVETGFVHFERLAIEAGGTTFSLGFHDRLTVIAGVGRLERDGLITELLSSLGPGRAGVHLELRSDAGSRYAIFRPAGGQHCVVDVDAAEDVTETFLARDGRINLLDRAGLNLPVARRAMRIGATDLTTDSRSDDWLLRLAHIDPGRLWDVARKFKDREARLAEAAADAGSTPEDAELYQEIERRHQEFEAAQAEHEKARHLSFLVAATSALIAVPGLVLIGPLAALPFLLAAIGVGIYSALLWQRLMVARVLEERILQQAGEHSYLTFQINRVNGLLASDHQRRRMIRCAEDHRAAAAEWHVLVGDIPIDWAIDRRHDVEQAHARLRDSVDGRNKMALALPAHQVTAAEVGAQLAQRLEQNRNLGAGRESMPTLLDEPFGDLPGPAKARLLELLVEAADHQQVILLTDDDDIADWARHGSMAGTVGLVEPAVDGQGGTDQGDGRADRRAAGSPATRVPGGRVPEDEGRRASSTTHKLASTKRRSRHVAA